MERQGERVAPSGAPARWTRALGNFTLAVGLLAIATGRDASDQHQREGADPPPPGHAISGRVSGAPRAIVRLSGAARAATTTGADGAYVFAGLPDGQYAVSAERPYEAFTPSGRDVTLAGADLGGQDFAAVTYHVAGAVRTPAGAAVPRVAVRLSGAADRFTVTDDAGRFSFDGLGNGAYVLAPASASYVFDAPAYAFAISCSDVSGADFVGRRVGELLEAEREVRGP